MKKYSTHDLKAGRSIFILNLVFINLRFIITISCTKFLAMQYERVILIGYK